jgi:hypothetical protein
MLDTKQNINMTSKESDICILVTLVKTSKELHFSQQNKILFLSQWHEFSGIE